MCNFKQSQENRGIHACIRVSYRPITCACLLGGLLCLWNVRAAVTEVENALRRVIINQYQLWFAMKMAEARHCQGVHE